jgi:hypothetical protein
VKSSESELNAGEAEVFELTFAPLVGRPKSFANGSADTAPTNFLLLIISTSTEEF